MNKNLLVLISIVVLTLAALVFIYPKTTIFGWNASRFAFGTKIVPWRLGLDLVGGTHLVYDVDLSKVSFGDQSSVLAGLRDIMEKRVNLFGVSEPNVVLSKTGDKNYLIIELAGVKNATEAISQIGRTALLEFREVFQEGTGKDAKVNFIPTELTGRYLTSARLTTDSLGRPQVGINFNDDGAKIFGDLTGKNIGKPLAILVDGQFISSPRVNEQILGGSAVITGLNSDEAKNLANLLNAGALPAPITLASQSTIGASLGTEFLNKAIVAGLLGTLLVMLFVILYYRSLGVVASLALLMYIILTLAVFKGISTTMSLSGIAGFILSIGMAVDANILIFERAKEELAKGLTKVSSIEEGFRRAWPSIRDSNFSTLITAFILYFFTTSFVQGFAFTLGLGVLLSLFSSITITRTLLRFLMK